MAFITILNIIGLVLSSSLVAFAFARIRFVGRDVLFLILLATMMLPQQVTLIPIYVFWSRLKAVNTYWPLIVPQWLTNAYNVFLLRQYMMTITPEYDDAARIDGAGWTRNYSQIIMPMSKPALGAVAIMSFMWHWRNYQGPLIYLSDNTKFTLSLGLSMFRTPFGGTPWHWLMAASLAVILPCIIVFFVFQRYFIQGIVVSGVKG